MNDARHTMVFAEMRATLSRDPEDAKKEVLKLEKLILNRALLEADRCVNALCERQCFPGLLCGVYFLFDKGELVYIGKSVNIFSRVADHCKKGTGYRKQFNEFSWMEVPEEALYEVESMLILKYRPRLNSMPAFRWPKRIGAEQ